MDKLKPCPCCGSERVDTLKGNWMESDKPFWKVWCKSCQVRTWCEPTRKGAIAVWNTRATDTALAAAEARIAELESDNAKLKEFAIEGFQTAFRGHDWYGDDIQDAGVRTGLLEQTAFDPDEHTTDCEFLEPGDTFYVFAALLKEKE